MKTAEEMTRDVLVRRDKTLNQNRKRRRTLAVSAALAAIVLLAALVIPRLGPQGQKPAIVAEGESTGTPEHTNAVSAPETGEDPSQTTAPSVSAAEPGPAPNILWTAGKIEENVSAESMHIEPRIADHVTASRTFFQILEAAKEGDVLAFVFSLTAGPENKRAFDENEANRLRVLFLNAQSRAVSVFQEIEKELTETRGITEAEAQARVTDMQAYQNAKDEEYRAQLAYYAYLNRARFSGTEDALSVMQEKGFSIVCSNTDDAYSDYQNWNLGMAVLTGTAAQIRALRLEGFAKGITDIKLYGTVPVPWEDDEYGAHLKPLHMQEDSKLTGKLREAYAANGGAPVKVVVKMAWIGEWIDPHEYAYAAMNVTEQEFQNINDWTMEQVQHYYEVLKYYTFPVREDTVTPLLEEGELVEIRGWRWDFIAELSEERALEICKEQEGHLQAAYIMSYEQELEQLQRYTGFSRDPDDEYLE